MLTGPSVHIKDIEVHVLTDLKYNFSEGDHVKLNFNIQNLSPFSSTYAADAETHLFFTPFNSIRD